jgi:PPOX class probable F420-dependent enzyme
LAELPDNIRNFLSQRRFAVAATINEDGTPQQTVVWYELQGDRIMMNTRVGRIKEKNLKRDPRMSFCIEDEYTYLYIKGRVELNYDQERAQADIKALAVRYDGEEVAEQKARERFSKQKRVTIYMSIEEVGGEEL